MGIQNKDGALYFATGVDNTGLYTGRREAIGIIKAMAGEITSFDVFGGLGLSAAAAFAQAGKDAYNFEKEFQKSMLEVASISGTISSSLADFMNKVLEVTQRVPVAANDAAKALYQIVSAGHDGADAMEILEVSAKAAIGGVTDTATSADAITTILNAYKMSASEAENVSDMLFTTARLGKTTMGELGQSIAQAAPIAASYGVEIDQVLAAVASLTKQGTPTAQAMTQIRASIIGVSKVLGDGAFDTRTFQEALQEVSDRSKGSESKLRELVPEIEAVNGVLGMTGGNAKNAASDLAELGNSSGAAEAAFKKMQESGSAQLQLLQNNITSALRPLGKELLEEVSGVAKSMNEAFSNGEIEKGLHTLETLIKLVSVAWVGYKVSTMDSLKTANLEAEMTKIQTTLKQAYHKAIGDGIIQKEKDRLTQEAYTASLEGSLTTEQLAIVEKQNLKKGSKEYANALSDVAVNAKKSADMEVESISKALNKNKDRLSAAKEQLSISQEATKAAKLELDSALDANDIAATEVAQTKLASAAKREESASTNVNTISRKINNQEKQLSVARSNADTASTVVNNATTAGNTVITNINSKSHNFLAAAKLKAAIATRTLTAAIAANPIGALLTVVSLAASAWFMFGNNTEKAKTKLQEFREEQDKLKESTNNLLNILYDTNEADRIRIEALETLKVMYPDVWKGVTLATLAEVDRNKAIKAQNTLLDENNEKKLKSLMLESQNRLSKLKEEDGKIIATSTSGATQTMDNSNAIQYEQKQLRELESRYYGVQSAKQKLLEESWPVDIQIPIYEKELKDLQGKIGEIKSKIGEATTAKKEFSLTDWGEAPKLEIPQFSSGFTLMDSIDLQLLEKQAEEVQAKLDKAKEIKNPAKKTGTGTNLTDAEKKAAEKRKNTLEEIAKSVLDVEINLQKEKVSIMADGREKALAEIEADKRERLKALDDEEKKLEEKYKSVGKSMPANVKADFGTRRQVVNEDAAYQTGATNKEYDRKEIEFQKELSSVFLTEEEKKQQAVQDRYDEMRRLQEDALQGELRNINQSKDSELEKNKAITEATLKYSGVLSQINNAQTFSENKDKKEKYDSFVSQLNDFKSKEYTLNKEWGKKITDAIATGDQELIERTKAGKEKALSQLNTQMLMESAEWLRLFGNLDTLTVDELNKLIDSIQKQLDSGTLKLNPVDAKALMDSLSKAKDKVAEKSPFQALAKSSGEMKSALAELKKAEESGLTGEALDAYKNKVKQTAEGVKKSISAIKNAYGQVSDVMRSAADLISMVDEGLGETVNNAISLGDAVMNVGDVVAQAVIGFAAGMSAMETASVILLVIKAVIMAVMAVMNLFNNDKKHEKKIQNLQKEIDNLQRAYDRLGKSIENAFSSDKAALIDQQSENLRQQNQKMLQQISEEEDKKKTDHDKIDDWRNKIEDNNAQIEENSKKNRIEAIMGTDIMDAIDQFAQAYADAWASGEKAAGKSANVVKSLIKTAIIDMLKKNLQPEVTAFMTFLSQALTDGIDAEEQKKIDEWEKKLENIADNTLAGKEKWLEDEDKNKESGVTGKLEAALTEGTACELVGLWNITAMDIRSLKELSADHFLEWKYMKLDVNAILQETIKIQQNTLRTADNTDGITSALSTLQKELAEIKKNTKNNNSNSRG